MKSLFVVGMGLCLLGISGLGTEEADKNVVKPSVSLTGTDSQVAKAGFERIVSMDQWVNVWKKHKGKVDKEQYDFFYDPLKIPRVDFERYMVIAVFEGSGWNCAGLNGESVAEKEDGITMRYSRKPFQTAGPGGGGRKVSVYGFFIIPRSKKPIVMEQKVYRTKGEKPTWQEVTKFEALKDE